MKVTFSGDASGDCFRDRPRPARDADQRYRNSVRSNFQKRAGMGMVPSNLRPFGWGSRSLAPEDLAAAGETIIWRELVPATFAPRPDPSGVRSVVVAEAARSGRPSHANRSGHPREAEVARAMEQALVEATDLLLVDTQSAVVPNLRRHGPRVIDRPSVTQLLFGESPSAALRRPPL